MAKSRFRRNWAALGLSLMWIVLLIADINLIWAPQSERDPSDKWMILFISFFLLLFSIQLPALLVEPFLGRRMQAAGDVLTTELPIEIDRDVRAARDEGEVPVPAFSLEVLTTNDMRPLSVEAQSLARRARDFYREGLRIHRQGLWFLFASHLAIALLGWTFGIPYPISPELVKAFVVASIVLTVIGNPVKIRSLQILGPWWLLHFAGIVVTFILATIYAVQSVRETNAAAGLLAGLTLAAIGAHAWNVRRRGRALRRKVTASPPLKLLFLWVFGSSESPQGLTFGFGAAWQYIGIIQLLSGAGFMGVEAFSAAKLIGRGKRADLIIKTPEELRARLDTFDDRPRFLSMYPHRTLLCNDAVWKLALHTLLNDTDVVLMDLRGFSPESRGAAYELGQLVDRFSTDRFVLLADQSTDVDFLSTSLRQAWEAMAVDSPNRRASAPIRVLHLLRDTAKKESQKLEENAREGDVLLELMCDCAMVSRSR